jgi:hypothetical protein
MSHRHVKTGDVALVASIHARLHVLVDLMHRSFSVSPHPKELRAPPNRPSRNLPVVGSRPPRHAIAPPSLLGAKRDPKMGGTDSDRRHRSAHLARDLPDDLFGPSHADEGKRWPPRSTGHPGLNCRRRLGPYKLGPIGRIAKTPCRRLNVSTSPALIGSMNHRRLADQITRLT